MSEPRDLLDFVGEPDRRYVSPVPANSPQRRQRAWLACVLVLAIGLPALVVTLGYNRPIEPALAQAAPATTTSTQRNTTSEKLATTEAPEETTTTVEETTTSTTAAPGTSTTYATSSTTASIPSTSTSTTAVGSGYQYVPASVAPTSIAAPTTTTTAYVAPVTAAPVTGEAAFLACVRMRESGGNYGAVSAGGTYRGAYQFHQATWDNTAAMAGRPDLIGVPPNLVAPSDQDLLAVTLYRAYGAGPWGGYCA